MNDTIKTILSRKSCKCFDPQKKVAKKDIEQVVNCGLHAPSTMNSQAWHFTVITAPEKLAELNKAVFESVDDTVKQRIISRNADSAFHFFYKATAFIIVSCSAASTFPFSDCACALENMQLAAESLSLGSCWINQLTTPGSEKAPIRAFLDKCGVAKDSKVYGCLALGYALKERAPLERAQNTVTYIE